jgi:hypothetical protein
MYTKFENYEENPYGGFNKTLTKHQESLTASSLLLAVQKPICYAALEQLISLARDKERKENEMAQTFKK